MTGRQQRHTSVSIYSVDNIEILKHRRNILQLLGI